MGAPWSAVVYESDDLFRDINATFLSTYAQVVGRNSKLARVMRLGVNSTKRVERYGYFESPPVIERWDRGKGITEDAFRGLAYSVENLTWGKAISYFEDDMEDLQLGDIRDVVRRLATRAAQLPEQVFFQIRNGSTNRKLLEAIPLAPDGAALYATTAGGVARFGVTDGNLITGTGVATAEDIRNDFWSGIEQAGQFQDTEGEPLLPDDFADSGVTIIYPITAREVFAEAFLQQRTTQTAGTAGVDLTSAAVTNPVTDAQINITLWGTQRVTDNDWSLHFDTVEPKAIFEQTRRAPRMIDETRENSERARRYRMLATLMDMRSGFGINAAYGTVKVNNA